MQEPDILISSKLVDAGAEIIYEDGLEIDDDLITKQFHESLNVKTTQILQDFKETSNRYSQRIKSLQILLNSEREKSKALQTRIIEMDRTFLNFDNLMKNERKKTLEAFRVSEKKQYVGILGKLFLKWMVKFRQNQHNKRIDHISQKHYKQRISRKCK